MKSIMTLTFDRCYICGRRDLPLETHHVFHGPRRKSADFYKLVVPLCPQCHRGTEGIHGRDGAELDKWLKRRGQLAFETYYSDKNFLEIFGKNYK